MSFFRKRKRPSRIRPEAEVQTKSNKKRKIFPAEVKLLAVEALELGLSPDEVSEIVGAGSSTIVKWRKLYLEGGERALIRQAAHPGTRKKGIPQNEAMKAIGHKTMSMAQRYDTVTAEDVIDVWKKLHNQD